MRCGNCGQEYKSSLKECPYCGYSEIRVLREKSKVKKKKTLPVIIILCLCIAIGLIAFTFINLMNKKTQKGKVVANCDVMSITDTQHINNQSSDYQYFSYVKDDQLYLFTDAGLVTYDMNDLENNKYTVVCEREYENPYVDDESIYYTSYNGVCYKSLQDESDVSMTLINSDKGSLYAKVYDHYIYYITGSSGDYTLWEYNKTTNNNRKIQRNSYYYFMYDEDTKIIYTIDKDYNLHEVNTVSLKDEVIASSVYDMYMYEDEIYIHGSTGVSILNEESVTSEYNYYSDFGVYKGKIIALEDNNIGYVNDDGTMDVFYSDGNIRDMEVQGDVILLRMYDDDYNEYWVAIDDEGNSAIIFDNDNS